jgi:hypothetical protein
MTPSAGSCCAQQTGMHMLWKHCLLLSTYLRRRTSICTLNLPPPRHLTLPDDATPHNSILLSSSGYLALVAAAMRGLVRSCGRGLVFNLQSQLRRSSSMSSPNTLKMKTPSPREGVSSVVSLRFCVPQGLPVQSSPFCEAGCDGTLFLLA